MIQLTPQEIDILEKFLRKELDLPNQETSNILGKIIDDADNLMRELDAYEELDGDLLQWYYNKYKSQQK